MSSSKDFWTFLSRLSDTIGVLGIGGLAAAIGGITTVWAALSSAAPTLTSVGWLFVFFTATGVTLLLLILAAISIERWRKTVAAPAQSEAQGVYLGDTRLRLRCFADTRTPIQVQQTNIWRWYSLLTGFRAIGKDGKATDSVITTLFVLFDRPITDLAQVLVSSPDFPMPEHEVKDWGPRHAIIVISGRVPDGELEVRMTRV